MNVYGADQQALVQPSSAEPPAPSAALAGPVLQCIASVLLGGLKHVSPDPELPGGTAVRPQRSGGEARAHSQVLWCSIKGNVLMVLMDLLSSQQAPQVLQRLPPQLVEQLAQEVSAQAERCARGPRTMGNLMMLGRCTEVHDLLLGVDPAARQQPARTAAPGGPLGSITLGCASRCQQKGCIKWQHAGCWQQQQQRSR
jgi:hypothetical protein